MARNDSLQEKLDLIDPEDFLAAYGVDYRMTRGSSGTQINVRECPRCGGNKWKVYLNAETGLGNCFHGSCVGEPGYNLFTFIRALSGDNKSAMSEIDRYLRDIGWRPRRVHQATAIGTSEWEFPACKPILSGSIAEKYMWRRGLDPQIGIDLGWMYCEKGYFEYEFDGETKHQNYSGRVIIPVRDLNENLVTFQGRDITGTQEPKYLFPPGLPGTGRFLYNAHNVRGMERLILVEGVFDLAAVYNAMMSQEIGVIASFGKTLSHLDDEGGSDQFGVLLAMKQDGLREITVMWDGGTATMNEGLRTAVFLNEHGFTARLAQLPDDKDPNEVSPDTILEAFRTAVCIDRRMANKLKFQQKLAAP